jgi:hypothetical protein
MPAPANLIREESTSTGTGNLTLAAVNGYVRFSDSTYAFGTGGTDAFWYFISNRNAAEWEIGTGHMSDANTLVRDTILFSSNSNAAVSFSAGTKDISNDIPASYQVFVEGTPAQGDIIYRGASAWSRLAAGTNGQFLKTQGAGADPQWASAGGLTLLNSGSVSSASTLDIVLTSYTAYRGLQIVLTGFRSVADAVDLHMRFSTNAGSSYATTNYRYSGLHVNSHASTVTGFNSNSAAEIQLLGGGALTSGAGLATNVVVDLLNQTSSSLYTQMKWAGSAPQNYDTSLRFITGAGDRNVAAATDAIRFLFSSGNIASGNWALYGYS